MMNFTVKDELCTRCDLCVSDCPARVVERIGDAVPQIKDNGELACIKCQHCLAVCPVAAISIFGKDPADSISLPVENPPNADQVAKLIRARRSIRHYKDCNVDSELIEKMLATVSNSPTGANTCKLTFRVIDDKNVMQKLRERVMADLRTANDAGKIPEAFAYLTQAVPAYFNYGTDIIFRKAPHLLIVTASKEALCPTEDIPIALTNFELLAQSEGLGTLWCGMLKMAVTAVPELGEVLGIPKGDSFYALLFGKPDIQYARTVQRDDAATIEKIKV